MQVALKSNVNYCYKRKAEEDLRQTGRDPEKREQYDYRSTDWHNWPKGKEFQKIPEAGRGKEWILP